MAGDIARVFDRAAKIGQIGTPALNHFADGIIALAPEIKAAVTMPPDVPITLMDVSRPLFIALAQMHIKTTDDLRARSKIELFRSTRLRDEALRSELRDYIARNNLKLRGEKD